MKIITITFLSVLFFSSQSFSQTFNNEDNVVNLGLGLGGVNMNMGVSAGASFEHGTIPIKKVGVISFGAYAGFTQSWQATYLYAGYNETWTQLILGARAAYHFTIIKVKNLDVYAGAIAGVGFGPHTWYENTYFGSPVKHSNVTLLPIGNVFGGARYYFMNNISVFGEVGAGTSYITGGISLKL